MPSLESNCESVLMALLAPEQSGGGRLAGIEFRHHDSNADAALDCLIFRAEAGEHQLEGPKLRAVKVEITYASGTATPDAADAIADATQERIYDSANWPTINFPELGGLVIEPETECSRSDGNAQRKRVVTVPLLAKLAA